MSMKKLVYFAVVNGQRIEGHAYNVCQYRVAKYCRENGISGGSPAIRPELVEHVPEPVEVPEDVAALVANLFKR